MNGFQRVDVDAFNLVRVGSCDWPAGPGLWDPERGGERERESWVGQILRDVDRHLRIHDMMWT